jgi:hypothetical protein
MIDPLSGSKHGGNLEILSRALGIHNGGLLWQLGPVRRVAHRSARG